MPHKRIGYAWMIAGFLHVTTAGAAEVVPVSNNNLQELPVAVQPPVTAPDAEKESAASSAGTEALPGQKQESEDAAVAPSQDHNVPQENVSANATISSTPQDTASVPPVSGNTAQEIQGPNREEPLPVIPEAQMKENVMIMPATLGDSSLMFRQGDINVLKPMMEIFRTSGKKTSTSASGGGKDDLNTLLESLKNKALGESKEEVEIPKRLPHIYLGSIVYYSPSDWTIWINSKKLTYKNNRSSNEFFVTGISMSQVELVWRPMSLLDMPSLWHSKAQNGRTLPAIALDESKGTVTLRLRPNQTFIPALLEIREGVVKYHVQVPAMAGRAAMPDAARAAGAETIPLPPRE